MELDFNTFLEACKPPDNSLLPGSSAHLQHYIDFSSVRGSNIVEELERTIKISSPDPTCQLLTGLRGCGKSMELLKLKAELEQQNFHVVYIEANRHLDMSYVGIDDILVTIACEVICNLEASHIPLRQEVILPILHEIASLSSQTTKGSELIRGDGINNKSLMETIRDNRDTYQKKIQELNRRYNTILQLINEELIKVIIEKLRQKGKKELVVIVDNLDHLDIQPMRSWRDPFIDEDVRLRKLNCHIIYTIPLALMFESDSQLSINRLGAPKVLSLIPVQLHNGRNCQKGIELLEHMVLVRAFPDLTQEQRQEQRLNLISQVFESSATLDRLCQVSGGHLKSFIELLFRCLSIKERPISNYCLESVIKEYYNPLIHEIKDSEWSFLIQLTEEQRDIKFINIQNNREILNYQELLITALKKKLLFEYFNNDGRWFVINPILVEAKMKDLFISYNGSDKKWAEWIAWVLEEAGYSVVIQAWDFRPGGNFILEMQKAAAGTKQTIAVLSKNYLDAVYTHSEWAAAFVRDPQGQERTLIPIRVGKCEPEGLLRGMIYVDLVDLAEQDARSKILEAFTERAKPAKAPIFPGAVSRVDQSISERTVSEPVQYPGSSTENSVSDSIIGKNSGSKILAVDRKGLMKQLIALPEDQFNILVYNINPPAPVRPMKGTQTERSIQLLNWAEGTGGCGLIKVQQELDEIINSL